MTPCRALPLELLMKYLPGQQQGLATSSNCSSISSGSSTGLVQHPKVADVVNQTKSSGLDFLTVGGFAKALHWPW